MISATAKRAQGWTKCPLHTLSAGALTPAWRSGTVLSRMSAKGAARNSAVQFSCPTRGKRVQSNRKFYAHQMSFHNLYLYMKKTSKLKNQQFLTEGVYLPLTRTSAS